MVACGGGPAAPTDPGGSLPSLACTIFPADNPWNADVSGYPVHPESAAFIARLGLTWRLSFVPNLPVNVVNTVRDHVPFVTITYTRSAGDPGPMPIPADARYHVKDPSKLVLDDNHLVLVDEGGCRLYELWSVAGPNADGSWTVGSGAIFDLTSNRLRPDHSPASAASGLPVFAGIARADEMRAGAIHHALSIPVTLTQEGFIHPATQWQSDQIYRTKLPLACGQPSFDFPELCARCWPGHSCTRIPTTSRWDSGSGSRRVSTWADTPVRPGYCSRRRSTTAYW